MAVNQEFKVYIVVERCDHDRDDYEIVHEVDIGMWPTEREALEAAERLEDMYDDRLAE